MFLTIQEALEKMELGWILKCCDSDFYYRKCKHEHGEYYEYYDRSNNLDSSDCKIESFIPLEIKSKWVVVGEIKPCIWCGGKNEIKNDIGKGKYYTSCTVCGAETGIYDSCYTLEESYNTVYDTLHRHKVEKE